MRIRLKELMQARGWTAAQVVEATGIGLNTVYKLRERSVSQVRGTTLSALAKAFDVSLDELLEID